MRCHRRKPQRPIDAAPSRLPPSNHPRWRPPHRGKRLPGRALQQFSLNGASVDAASWAPELGIAVEPEILQASPSQSRCRTGAVGASAGPSHGPGAVRRRRIGRNGAFRASAESRREQGSADPALRQKRGSDLPASSMDRRIPKWIEGFTREVPFYMELSDFFIGKPGPGSVSEALVRRLPVIVQRSAWTMAHERYNLDLDRALKSAWWSAAFSWRSPQPSRPWRFRALLTLPSTRGFHAQSCCP